MLFAFLRLRAQEILPSKTGILFSTGRSFTSKGSAGVLFPREEATPPRTEDFLDYVEQDAKKMKEAGVNAVRTYVPITDPRVIEKLEDNGIYLIQPIDPLLPADEVKKLIYETKEIGGILMWSLGNEWNYNRLYTMPRLSLEESVERIQAAAAIIKASDPSRPIMTVYGEVPPKHIIDRLDDISVWALNVYRGDSFGDLFTTWIGRTSDNPKPMVLGEYGADAYNSKSNSEDQAAQAYATDALLREIQSHSTVLATHGQRSDVDGCCSGGFLFEWNDEWWKGEGDWGEQDTSGIAPGGGPWPDYTFNEEWWGVTSLERDYSGCAPDAISAVADGCSLREAYYAYKNVSLPIRSDVGSP